MSEELERIDDKSPSKRLVSGCVNLPLPYIQRQPRGEIM